MFSDEKSESREYEGSGEDELSSRGLDAESYCVMGTCKTGKHSAPGSWNLYTGTECDPGLAEMPEVLSLPDSSRNGEKCAALEQQSLRNLRGEMGPRIRSISLLLCRHGATCSFLHRTWKKEFL